MEVLRWTGEGEGGKTSSGGMFSPRVRVSLSSFLRFSWDVRACRGCEDVDVSMLKEEDIEARGFDWSGGGIADFIVVET